MDAYKRCQTSHMVGPKHSIADIFHLSIFLRPGKKESIPPGKSSTIGETFEFDY